jgi:hypothetical protein
MMVHTIKRRHRAEVRAAPNSCKTNKKEKRKGRRKEERELYESQPRTQHDTTQHGTHIRKAKENTIPVINATVVMVTHCYTFYPGKKKKNITTT